MLAEFQTDNLLWFLIGAGIGAAASWSLQAMRYARRAVRKVDRMEEDMRDDRGRVDLQSFGIGIMVTLVAVAAILAGIASKRSDETSDRVEDLAQCNRSILERTVKALNERTAFSDESAEARHDLNQTQSDLVDALLDPAATDAEKVALARRYQTAVDHQLRLDRRNNAKREQYPYPSAAEIREC